MSSHWLVSGCLLIVGLIHLLPSVAAVSVDRLQMLYGTEFTSLESILLLRHRAVLFGILGGVIVLEAMRPEWHWLGLMIGLVSVISFLMLSYQVPSLNAALTRVVQVDGFALLLLLLGCGFKLLKPN